MKTIKIRNLADKEEILENLIILLQQDEENKNCWPLGEPSNYPNEDFYIIVDNGKIIPAYISVKDKEALVLWVEKNYRKKGYAKFLVKSLNVEYTVAHETSVPFWESMNFKRLNSSGAIRMKFKKMR